MKKTFVLTKMKERSKPAKNAVTVRTGLKAGACSACINGMKFCDARMPMGC